MKILISCIVFIFMISGCSQINNVDFVEVVYDHKIVTVETCDRLILSIDDELAKDIDSSRVKSLLDLRERLLYMSRSSEVIQEWVSQEYVTPELLAELVRNKWNKGGN
jgi:hypothetical protein